MLDEVRAFLEEPRPEGFDDLALRVFRFQFEGNEAYRRFCERRGVVPGRVRDWTEIPAVPVAAFKHADLSVAGLGEGLVFVTSGTTGGSERRGRHRVPDPSIYRTAALRHFEDMVLPDGARAPLVILAPAVGEQPQSSLARMIGWIDEAFGRGSGEVFVRDGEVDVAALVERLRAAEPTREPVLVIGVTSAFVRLLDHCAAGGIRLRLPYGSRIVDTGGSKGLSRPMSRNGLLRAFWETLGVAGYFVANEYGMTEMCSQFYDGSIRDHVEGRKRDRCKISPPWVRTQIVSPETLDPVRPGERGILRHLDLANVGSVSALQTEDLGVAVGEGFEVLGRVRGAEARGCALLLREVVA